MTPRLTRFDDVKVFKFGVIGAAARVVVVTVSRVCCDIMVKSDGSLMTAEEGTEDFCTAFYCKVCFGDAGGSFYGASFDLGEFEGVVSACFK